MTDDVSKLPAWPKQPSEKGQYPAGFWTIYDAKRIEYYKARMEALVEHLRALKMSAHLPCCNLPYDFPCCCGLGDLLAACAREEGR